MTKIRFKPYLVPDLHSHEHKIQKPKEQHDKENHELKEHHGQESQRVQKGHGYGNRDEHDHNHEEHSKPLPKYFYWDGALGFAYSNLNSHGHFGPKLFLGVGKQWIKHSAGFKVGTSLHYSYLASHKKEFKSEFHQAIVTADVGIAKLWKKVSLAFYLNFGPQTLISKSVLFPGNFAPIPFTGFGVHLNLMACLEVGRRLSVSFCPQVGLNALPVQHNSRSLQSRTWGGMIRISGRKELKK